MLGHSMGANIGLHYLHQNPDMFECAAFTTPMIGLKAFQFVPTPLALLATGLLNFFADTAYVVGGGDWRHEMRPSPGNDSFSSDPDRGAIHNAWCLADPELQVGRITYSWLYHAARSCAKLRNKNVLRSIQTHCLFALAGYEDFVSNNAIRKAQQSMPNVKLLEFPDARHEILMEKDGIRKLFFEAFYKLVEENIIARPETLKPL